MLLILELKRYQKAEPYVEYMPSYIESQDQPNLQLTFCLLYKDSKTWDGGDFREPMGLTVSETLKSRVYGA